MLKKWLKRQNISKKNRRKPSRHPERDLGEGQRCHSKKNFMPEHLPWIYQLAPVEQQCEENRVSELLSSLQCGFENNQRMMNLLPMQQQWSYATPKTEQALDLTLPESALSQAKYCGVMEPIAFESNEVLSTEVLQLETEPQTFPLPTSCVNQRSIFDDVQHYVDAQGSGVINFYHPSTTVGSAGCVTWQNLCNITTRHSVHFRQQKISEPSRILLGSSCDQQYERVLSEFRNLFYGLIDNGKCWPSDTGITFRRPPEQLYIALAQLCDLPIEWLSADLQKGNTILLQRFALSMKKQLNDIKFSI